MKNTKKVVEYSRGLTFDKLPETVVSGAKTLVLDTIGALFAAWPSRNPASRIIGDYVKDIGGIQECTVFGQDFKAPVVYAALVGGTMGYAADVEGGILSPPPVHVAASNVPTALVIGEKQNASGAELITALCLGYDITDRVSKANATPHSYPHSFHPSAVFGTFGAVAIAGYLLKLDERQFINAFGLAGNNAGGLIAWVNDPSEQSRPLNNGLAARNGTQAAMLAAKGFGGPLGILDDIKYNIFEAYSGAMNLAEITRDLGSDFAITRHDGYKKYTCCYDIHTGLDALLKILNQHNLEPGQIEQIIHTVSEVRRPVIDNNILRSHNAQYIMSVVAVERQLQWDDFLKDRRLETEIGEMYQRVCLEGSRELANSPYHEPAIVEVKTKDGKSYTEQVDLPRGHLKNPMTQEEVEQKFRRFAATAVSDERAQKIIDLVGQLETLSSVRELTALLGGTWVRS